MEEKERERRSNRFSVLSIEWREMWRIQLRRISAFESAG